MQSNPTQKDGLHVAIIMDGNGRWAARQGLSRSLGHRTGVDTVRHVAEAAPELGIGTLTLFAFSSDNWRRPASEIEALMGLLRLYLRVETRRLVEGGFRLTVIGRRDRLPDGLAEAIARAEMETGTGRRLHLRIAFDYSSRYAIAQAAQGCGGDGLSAPDAIARSLHRRGGGPDVDLLIRSGGEKRLSDFLLWECAYAELFFSDLMWPEFSAADLAAAVGEYRRRERRFGALPEMASITPDSVPRSVARGLVATG
jgi:undecaprenyl diphosphate synthase